VIALAGPNGAGKSTVGPPLLKETLGVVQFVDADLIAAGLSAFAPETTALTAGKLMRRRLAELAASRTSFAFETTLAGRSYARWLTGLVASGYNFHLVFLSLPSAEFAVERVRDRVRRGGHSVSKETIRRRFDAGLRNFFGLYRSLADTWRIYDNSGTPPPAPIAAGQGREVSRLHDPAAWSTLLVRYGGTDAA
jgi:predicted ABC-type ATPase